MKTTLLALLFFGSWVCYAQEPLRINKKQTSYLSCGSTNLYASAFELTNGENSDKANKLPRDPQSTRCRWL